MCIRDSSRPPYIYAPGEHLDFPHAAEGGAHNDGADTVALVVVVDVAHAQHAGVLRGGELLPCALLVPVLGFWGKVYSGVSDTEVQWYRRCSTDEVREQRSRSASHGAV
eukprot:4597745-Pyramimonas_sp.AAC.1